MLKNDYLCTMIDFKNRSSTELLDFILPGNKQSDKAMCYVLKERVGVWLKEKHKSHEP